MRRCKYHYLVEALLWHLPVDKKIGRCASKILIYEPTTTECWRWAIVERPSPVESRAHGKAGEEPEDLENRLGPNLGPKTCSFSTIPGPTLTAR